MEKKLLTRADQKVEDTWDLSSLYPSDEAFSKDAELLEQKVEAFKAFQGTLANGAENFLNLLKSYDELHGIFSNLMVYANQKYHQDTANAVYQQMSTEIEIMGTRISEAGSWMDPEILALPEETIQGYFAEKPELENYRRFLYLITREREHVLDAKTEALLSRAGELGSAPSNIFAMFNNADIRFNDIEDENGEKRPLTQGSYVPSLESRDRVLRKNAFESMYAVHKQYRNTIASVYYSNLKQADFFAKERGFAGAMDEALFKTEIPSEVYTNLLDAIHEALPLMHRYVTLRKKMLKVPELHMYDVYVPIVETPDKKYTFDEAEQIVKQGLAVLGEDYQALLQKGFDERWIDKYENTGKRTGAYSWGTYSSNPFVLMNFHGSLDNVFTLAHEMGHSLHTYHSNRTQTRINAHYRIFVAEVASTCNESLLLHDLLERTEDVEEKKYLINHFLDTIKGTIFRQTMFAEFEMLTHEVVRNGGALPSEQICGIYLNLNKKYFGEDMISDPEIAFEWQRIPHFYTPFYVYQYATGLSAALAISSKILAGEEGIVEKYKKFLSGGNSMSPIDLLKICDVDMSSPEPVKQAMGVFEQYLGMLEEYVK
ncbi:MAG: oligoendopeptidase F [Clostridiales bacterium]|nr:oligoendopeptidase F [Candidatus Blautia equi]